VRALLPGELEAVRVVGGAERVEGGSAGHHLAGLQVLQVAGEVGGLEAAGGAALDDAAVGRQLGAAGPAGPEEDGLAGAGLGRRAAMELVALELVAELGGDRWPGGLQQVLGRRGAAGRVHRELVGHLGGGGVRA
jgi:hypothetical protein